MPPRSKQTPAWGECLKCNVTVSDKDLSKHRSECDADKPLSHGYILGSTCYALIVPFPDVDGKDQKLQLPAVLQDNVVLMNPLLMNRCGFEIGSYCLVNKNQIRVSWPCSSVSRTSLALSAVSLQGIDYKLGQTVTVESFHDNIQLAGEIIISGDIGEMDEKLNSILEFAKNNLCGKFVCSGNKFTLCYYGKKINILIKYVVGTAVESQTVLMKSEWMNNQKAQDINTSSVSDSLANMSITESNVGCCMEYNMSTPLKCNHSGQLTNDYLSILNESVISDQDSFTSCNTSNIVQTELTPNGSRTCQRDISSISNSSLVNKFFATLKVRSVPANSSNQFYKVTKKTKFLLEKKEHDNTAKEEDKRTMAQYIGGLGKQIEALKELIHFPLEQPELCRNYGVRLQHGVLIFGPSGCGKTMLVKAVASEVPAHVVHISGSEVWSKFIGETEAKLRNIFKDAVEKSPSLIIIEEVDCLCPKREATHNEVEKRVVATLITLMDTINNNDYSKFVMVLGTTSKPDLIDPALRRAGRFDTEVEVGVPTATERREILQCLLSKLRHNLSSDNLYVIADSCHGYVGADLASLCQEASRYCMKKCGSENLDKLCITLDHMQYAMHLVQPSAMREVQVEVPKVLWSDIGGQELIKQKLKQAVEWPLKHPEAFARMGITPPRGILMYGPPGCSKTMVAKALATESGLNFMAVKGPELFSKWVGESEKAVREVFRKARSVSPSIIFFDEIDALAVQRGSSSGSNNVADRVLAQILTEIDGVEALNDVTIVAATNRPDMIDQALLRPGRFDRVMYVPLPDLKTRQEIFQIELLKKPVDSDVTAEWLAENTNRYSGAEIAEVCQEAGRSALLEDMNSEVIMRKHFEKALEVVPPRTTDYWIQFYENYGLQSGVQSI